MFDDADGQLAFFDQFGIAIQDRLRGDAGPHIKVIGLDSGDAVLIAQLTGGLQHLLDFVFGRGRDQIGSPGQSIFPQNTGGLAISVHIEGGVGVLGSGSSQVHQLDGLRVNDGDVSTGAGQIDGNVLGDLIQIPAGRQGMVILEIFLIPAAAAKPGGGSGGGGFCSRDGGISQLWAGCQRGFQVGDHFFFRRSVLSQMYLHQAASQTQQVHMRVVEACADKVSVQIIFKERFSGGLALRAHLFLRAYGKESIVFYGQGLGKMAVAGIDGSIGPKSDHKGFPSLSLKSKSMLLETKTSVNVI